MGRPIQDIMSKTGHNYIITNKMFLILAKFRHVLKSEAAHEAVLVAAQNVNNLDRIFLNLICNMFPPPPQKKIINLRKAAYEAVHEAVHEAAKIHPITLS